MENLFVNFMHSPIIFITIIIMVVFITTLMIKSVLRAFNEKRSVQEAGIFENKEGDFSISIPSKIFLGICFLILSFIMKDFLKEKWDDLPKEEYSTKTINSESREYSVPFDQYAGWNQEDDEEIKKYNISNTEKILSFSDIEINYYLNKDKIEFVPESLVDAINRTFTAYEFSNRSVIVVESHVPEGNNNEKEFSLQIALTLANYLLTYAKESNFKLDKTNIVAIPLGSNEPKNKNNNQIINLKVVSIAELAKSQGDYFELQN